MSYVEKNPWILHFDGSGCSGCGMEVQACFSPKFDVEQYGVRKTDNPKHADVLLITGIVEEENRDYLVHLYENMAEPKAVVAVGACACSGGIFEGCGDVVCGADQVLPVDLYVPGCAARPEIIIDGILKCFEKPETLEAVSYTHLDVYKRQKKRSMKIAETGAGAASVESEASMEDIAQEAEKLLGVNVEIK